MDRFEGGLPNGETKPECADVLFQWVIAGHLRDAKSSHVVVYAVNHNSDKIRSGMAGIAD